MGHSERRVIEGSTRAACRIGPSAATQAIVASTSGAATSGSGESGDEP